MSKTSIWWVLYFPSKSNALVSTHLQEQTTLWANITFNMFGRAVLRRKTAKPKFSPPIQWIIHTLESGLTILKYHGSWSIFFHLHLNLQVMEDSPIQSDHHLLPWKTSWGHWSSPSVHSFKPFQVLVQGIPAWMWCCRIFGGVNDSKPLAHRGKLPKGGNQWKSNQLLASVASTLPEMCEKAPESGLWASSSTLWVLQVQKLKCRESRCLKYGPARCCKHQLGQTQAGLLVNPKLERSHAWVCPLGSLSSQASNPNLARFIHTLIRLGVTRVYVYVYTQCRSRTQWLYRKPGSSCHAKRGCRGRSWKCCCYAATGKGICPICHRVSGVRKKHQFFGATLWKIRNSWGRS